MNQKHAVGGGTFLPLHNRCISPKQRLSSQDSTSYKSSHVLGSQSITGGPLHKCKTGSPHATHTHQNRTPATTNTITNRQLDGIWRHHKKTFQKQQRQWTCGFICFTTASSNNNSDSTCSQRKQILQTTGQNTLPLPTINTWDQFSSTSKKREHSSKQQQGGDGHNKQKMATRADMNTNQWHQAQKTKKGVSHSHMPEQLQVCAGIPKVPNPNTEQFTDRTKIGLTPTIGRDKQSPKQEANRCFQMEGPEDSGWNSSHKISLAMVSNCWQW